MTWDAGPDTSYEDSVVPDCGGLNVVVRRCRRATPRQAATPPSQPHDLLRLPTVEFQATSQNSVKEYTVATFD